MFNLSRLLSPKSQQLAALDLGSNSFHLIIADWEDGELKVRDKVKEMVRLGWGLQDDGSLDAAAWNRAQACLERFGERLREFKPGSVRVVGTKTLRSIIDADVFLQAAEQRLGHPVEVISGEEEARLIYLGVAHYKAPTNGPRMVIDIGGGSTEVTLGEGMDLKLKESLDMGCVSITKRFFKSGRVTKNRLLKASVYCSQQLLPVADDFLEHGWNECLGASGTIKAVAKVCVDNNFCENEIQLSGLDAIVEHYLEAGECNLPLKGLSEERQPVFLGGVLVLQALFQALGITSMHAAESALREGLLYELKGRLEHSDIRPSSVQRLAERYHVDSQFSGRVDTTCQLLLNQVAETWSLDEVETNKLLTWASQLFLVGLDVAHSDYHKHGAYIVEHVDLAGFSRLEQQQLAALVLAHRRRFPVKQFPLQNTDLLKACLILRLSVIFNRGKRRQTLPELQFRAAGQQMSLLLDQQWLQNNPLTRADLENEQQYLSQIDYKLDLIEL
ncbi:MULTISPECIES: Ppx/GppA phosphatase family protein [unclassified Agarivorans]|uniref:Ppx/GppA phosphatase family protein n=1 Tax=unclassified Agarivorans TaxID=2636026 RepID=UPI0010EC3456|nr:MULTISPECIES: Ppx/GppA phosphatase family protein [unclassified Agarivorans]MDO6763428.1 Ppx/GppA phosphatase family protein [Agarivorans sp. 1_MG-2023]GDY26259.1 exopolyphosphatase [Agarivorans sp. Toyoura001]